MLACQVPLKVRQATLWPLVFLTAFWTSSALAATTKIDVDTTPSGAKVFLGIDGEERSLGTTPLKASAVPRGRIALRFELEGHKGLVELIEVGKKPSRFVFKLEKTNQPGVLDVAGGAAFHGASLFLNGQVVGTLPGRISVPAGRHQLRISHKGYEDWEKWLEVERGKTISLNPVLTPLTEKSASVVVTSTPSGAIVHINGLMKGKTPQSISGLAPGRYQVLLKLDGYEEQTKDFTLRQGAQSLLEITLEEAASRFGSIKVLTSVEGADVRVDGEVVGKAPIKVPKLVPGLHLVEARANGYGIARREVTVRAGETTVTRLGLEAKKVEPAPATVRVTCKTTGAKISLDGGEEEDIAETLVIKNAADHIIKVRAPRHTTWTKRFSAAPGQVLEFEANLLPQAQLLVEVASGVEAEVFLDGVLLGMTPLNTWVETGQRALEVRREKSPPEKRRLKLEADKTSKFRAFKAEALAAKGERTMSLSAKSVGQGKGSLDLMVGWPFILEMRINGGITKQLDVGFTFRNLFDAISEFEGRIKYTYARSSLLAAAAEVSIGGGGGSLDRNSFVFRATALGSIFIANKLAMTIHAGGSVFSDRLAPEAGDLTAPPNLTPSIAEGERDTGFELVAGARLEFKVSENWNMAIFFEAMPIRTGSFTSKTSDGEPVDLQGRLLLYEGVAGDLKAQFFRASIGATYLF